MKEIVTLNWGQAPQAATNLQQERITSFKDMLSPLLGQIEGIGREYVAKGLDLRSWETYNNGIMVRLEQAYDLADDGVENQSRIRQLASTFCETFGGFAKMNEAERSETPGSSAHWGLTARSSRFDCSHPHRASVTRFGLVVDL